MRVEIVVPGVGESVSEGMLSAWKIRSGTYVEKDEPVAELETDKATVEVGAPAAGVLETLVAEGAVVKVGAPIAVVDTAAAAPSREKSAPSRAEAVVEDVQRHGPAVANLVRETGVDLGQVERSGRGGRATKGDVLRAIGGRPEHAPEPPVPAPAEPLRSASADARAIRRQPMTMIRRRIAERLLAAQQQAAILTTFNEVDMSAVKQLREQYKDAFEKKHGVKLGFMGFFIRAVTEALREFPNVNASIDGTDIVYHEYCDIGVAVSTDKGLMVPVLRNAETLSIPELEKGLAAFAKRARENKITVEELSGGTFSITNGGVFGSMLSTPILNPPQSGILGMHNIQMRPVCLPDGRIEGRPMMYVALSYDHRLIDGRDAVGFLVRVKQAIEDPGRLLLGV